MDLVQVSKPKAAFFAVVIRQESIRLGMGRIRLENQIRPFDRLVFATVVH